MLDQAHQAEAARYLHVNDFNRPDVVSAEYLRQFTLVLFRVVEFGTAYDERPAGQEAAVEVRECEGRAVRRDDEPGAAEIGRGDGNVNCTGQLPSADGVCLLSFSPGRDCAVMSGRSVIDAEPGQPK